MKHLVLLDRDGVINHDSDEYIKSPAEWQLIDGVGEAIARLNQSGVSCAVVSNQSGIMRKLFKLDDLMQINQKMRKVLAEKNARLEFMLYCPHSPDADCDCRKPKPKLLLEAMDRTGVKPKNAVFIGDSLRDIQAALQAEIRPILLRTGNGRKTETEGHVDLDGVEICDNLGEFVQNYLDELAAIDADA